MLDERTHPGRPRNEPRRRTGLTARDEILDAAAELFTESGYAGTTTRAIATAVGIKQASLYYHFASKEDVLAELLVQTVQPSLTYARAAAGAGQPNDVELYGLAAFDVALLCAGPWNLGALYLLPELRHERFAEFRGYRQELAEEYQRLVRAGADAGEFIVDDETVSARLVLALVESVISLRWESEVRDADVLADTIAVGCLRLLRVPAKRIESARRAARQAG